MTAGGEQLPGEHGPWGEPHTKTITWFDWRSGGDGREAVSGLELVQGILDGRIPPPPAAARRSTTGSRQPTRRSRTSWA